jgi:MFS family permease
MLLVVIGVALSQQLCGIEAIVYYTPIILKDIVPSRQDVLWLTFLVGFFKTGTLVVIAFLLDHPKAGRRRLLLASTSGVTVSFLILAIGLQLGLKWVAISGIFLFAIAFSFGLGPITWLFASEILPTHIRAKGMTLACSLNRLCSAGIALTFLSLKQEVLFFCTQTTDKKYQPLCSRSDDGRRSLLPLLPGFLVHLRLHFYGRP